jgi:predicted RNase H-like HicB family nuclease
LGDEEMKIHNYTVIFEPLQEGGYDVIVPAIPEICTFGETREEARKMAEDAIRCYLEGIRLLYHGKYRSQRHP